MFSLSLLAVEASAYYHAPSCRELYVLLADYGKEASEFKSNTGTSFTLYDSPYCALLGL